MLLFNWNLDFILQLGLKNATISKSNMHFITVCKTKQASCLAIVCAGVM